MTRSRKPPISSSKASKALGKARVAKPRSGFWVLQDAKARFSELVRKVRSEGPQHVTVHGRDEVVVVAAEEFRRLQGRRFFGDARVRSPADRMLVEFFVQLLRQRTA